MAKRLKHYEVSTAHGNNESHTLGKGSQWLVWYASLITLGGKSEPNPK